MPRIHHPPHLTPSQLGRYGPPRFDDQEPPTPERSRRPWEDEPSRTPTPAHEISQAVAQRSRWQAMLMEAGGLGAAVSEESMRRLKYCLQWLQVCVLVIWVFVAYRRTVCHSTHRYTDLGATRLYGVLAACARIKRIRISATHASPKRRQA